MSAKSQPHNTYSRAACRRIYVSEDTSSVVFPILTIALSHTLSIKDRSKRRELGRGWLVVGQDGERNEFLHFRRFMLD